MSVQTKSSRHPGAVRRDRLPRGAAPVSRRREITLGVLGTIGLLLLVVGIPAALVIFVGYPLPRSAPSAAWVTVAVSATLIIKILACVVWMVWAHFVVCLLAEWRSIRRGRVPGHVVLGGGSQLLARRLVAAALLLAGAATTFAQTAGPATTNTVVSSVHQQVARPTVGGGFSTDDASIRAAAAQSDPSEDAPLKYYVVQPPHGRRYDSLWDIAERTLKDPLRYKEIFALNNDRTQSDGRKLIDANLIQPGWQLRLPADAAGPGVHTTLVPPPLSAGPATASPATSGAAGHGAGQAAQGDRSARVADTPASSRSDDANAVSLDVSMFGGALMLAGIVTALTARRGPYGDPVDDEDELAGLADTVLAAGLDRALRNLSAGRQAQRRELPQPILAFVSATEVRLTLAAGDVADPPAPWRADGRSWSVRLDAVADADVAAPYPGLASVGRTEDYELFVDLEQAPGLIALGGDAERARELATALAVQACTCAWSDGARVTLVGFGNAADIAQLAPGSIEHTTTLSTVLDGVETEHADAAALRRQLGVDGVLTGRQLRRSTAWRPHLLVLSGPPTPAELTRLQRIVGDGRSQFVAIAVGDERGARWRFSLSPDGSIDLGALGTTATAHRLGLAGIARLASMAKAAGLSRQTSSAELRAVTPRSAVAATAAATGPAPQRHVVHAPQVRVTLLGPVGVVAAGPVLESRRGLLTAMTVAVALHPDGLHDAIFKTLVWPRGVTDEVFRAAVGDAVRWLGPDSTGRPALREENGRWFLGDTVRVDWDELRYAASSTTGETQLTQLSEALALFTGEAFSGSVAPFQGWLAFRRAAREARLVGTAVARRVAQLNLAAGQDEAAEEALRAGLLLVPTSEPLWRELLALAARRGPDPAVAVAAEMYETLQRMRVWPEAETDALVAQLAPDYRVPETTGTSAN